MTRGTVGARTVIDKKIVHVHDVLADPDYQAAEYQSRGGYRTVLGVPLLRGDEAIGVFTLAHTVVKPFTEKQIELVTTFADQAVIAIENVRLFDEVKARTEDLRESLQQQIATADVLKVISRSAFDLDTVMNTLARSALELCGSKTATLFLREEDTLVIRGRAPDERFDEDLLKTPVPLNEESHMGQAILTGTVANVADIVNSKTKVRKFQKAMGFRSFLAVPLMREGRGIGVFTLTRDEIGAFDQRKVELVQSFADQAVIAIENVRLFDEVQARTRELSESLRQQIATSDVLKVISRSTFDLQPVFDVIAENAVALCEAERAFIFRYEGRVLRAVAHCNAGPEVRQFVYQNPIVPGRQSISARAALERRTIHVADVQDDPEYQYALRDVSPIRTLLAVPMLKGDELVGVITSYRLEVKPFSNEQIALLETFANQAVIAIENARLFNDTNEALERQTATADVLKVISRSSVDLETVLDTLVETVARLCRADQATMFRRRDDKYDLVAARGLSAEGKEFLLIHPPTHDRGGLNGRVAAERRPIHIPDVLQDPEYTYREGQKIIGYRTLLGIPLLREQTLIGIFTINRTRVEPFTDKEIELATSFADQAVIAIENARLFEELRDRQAELARSVDELTATGDVLKIISRSTVDLDMVLDTLVETVARLCRADTAAMYRRQGNQYHPIASRGLSDEAAEFLLAHPLTADRGTLVGRAELDRRAVHIPDVLEDPEYTYKEGQKVVGFRTLLGIPLLRKDTLIGIFSVTRRRVDPFTAREIELITTFADQAVIAIENARLFEELRERQAELRVTFDNMGDGVAMFATDTHLAACNRNFQELLDLPDALLAARPSFAELFRYLVERGEFGSADLESELSRSLEDTSREMRYERTRPDGRVIEVRRNPVPDGGFVMIYADITERKRAEEAIRLARDAAETALRDLQTAQASLVHAQKMAALGQLTAGIAHEIKNPLNFVNNFAALSSELTDELGDVLKPVTLPSKVREEVDELTGTLKDNLGRVVQHGKRADSIVKNMLLHSREGSGEHRPVEINAIIDESLNLAYHGARAEKQGFNITLERDFDPQAGVADIYPQEVTRAFLNLISNGFYAATQRAATNGSEPKLKASTRNLGDKVEIRIRDNGMGIPPDVREKIFNPFFTTKPAGEGTGLGLSMSHDIVVKQHGGTIEVLTEPGLFTEFIITLPRVLP